MFQILCKSPYRLPLIAITATLLPMALTYWLKNRFKKKLQKLKLLYQESESSYYQCIFWTMNNHQCRDHIIESIECGEDCSTVKLQTILNLLSSAKYSICMCMYFATLKQITDELIKARNRGVKIRILTDFGTSKMKHSKFRLLKDKFGFDVRTPKNDISYMHHKFCVIDSEDSTLQKMFMGSLNLTLQGCTANFEFVVITNNPKMIQRYQTEFELLWTEFDYSRKR